MKTGSRQSKKGLIGQDLDVHADG